MKSVFIAKFFASVSVLAVTVATAGVTPNVLDSSGKPVRDGSGACVQNLNSVEHPDCVAKKPEPVKPVVPAPQPVAPPPPVAAPAPVRPAAPPPPPAKQVITLQSESLFDTNKSVLKPGGKKSIDDAIAKMYTLDVASIEAIGHTDSVGSDAYNQKLSERRARAVEAYMVTKGIPASQVTTIGKGESQPVASNKTAAGRSKNRRVDLVFKGKSK